MSYSMDHHNLYITYTEDGMPGLLVSPTRLESHGELPGWFGVFMRDERELYKLAGQFMDIADEMKRKRDEGKFPEYRE